MEMNSTFFEAIKIVIFWLAPFLFVVGIVLVLYSNYKRLEEILGKEFFRVKLIPAIETNIYSFHEWLLERRTIIGLLCIIISVIIFMALKK